MLKTKAVRNEARFGRAVDVPGALPGGPKIAHLMAHGADPRARQSRCGEQRSRTWKPVDLRTSPAGVNACARCAALLAPAAPGKRRRPVAVVVPEEYTDVDTAYGETLAAADLGEGSRRIYASRVRGYLAYLGNADPESFENRDPLTDPHGRNYAVREFLSTSRPCDTPSPRRSRATTPPWTTSTATTSMSTRTDSVVSVVGVIAARLLASVGSPACTSRLPGYQPSTASPAKRARACRSPVAKSANSARADQIRAVARGSVLTVAMYHGPTSVESTSDTDTRRRPGPRNPSQITFSLQPIFPSTTATLVVS